MNRCENLCPISSLRLINDCSPSGMLQPSSSKLKFIRIYDTSKNSDFSLGSGTSVGSGVITLFTNQSPGPVRLTLNWPVEGDAYDKICRRPLLIIPWLDSRTLSEIVLYHTSHDAMECSQNLSLRPGVLLDCNCSHRHRLSLHVPVHVQLYEPSTIRRARNDFTRRHR